MSSITDYHRLLPLNSFRWLQPWWIIKFSSLRLWNISFCEFLRKFIPYFPQSHEINNNFSLKNWASFLSPKFVQISRTLPYRDSEWHHRDAQRCGMLMTVVSYLHMESKTTQDQVSSHTNFVCNPEILGQNLRIFFATSQPQIRLILSKQLIFIKLCRNQI